MSVIIAIQPDMLPLRDASKVEKGDRVFYELGHKIKDSIEQNGVIHILGYEDNWIRTGRFKEVDISRFSKDGDITNVDYLEHHNFMIIKKKI